jgi:DNA-binding CsgD family transcriptional regulator/tetratricopeptide (TPR) repeat protein
MRTADPGQLDRVLLERDQSLAMLAGLLGDVRKSSQGRLVLVGGEAGVGKTLFLRRFCRANGERARVLWGACVPLRTPRPLGPLVDVAEATRGELEQLVAAGTRPHDVAAALLGELRRTSPTLLVLEDLHWADEATLDVLALLAARIASAPALVLASYRDDELDRTHQLRLLLGELVRRPGRMKLEALSRAAVAELARPYGVDPEQLYRRTGGNPFFVTEVLAAGGEQVPETARDAVLARTARLSEPARGLLDAVAVIPGHLEIGLLEVLAGELVERLEECLASGMLAAESGGVAFRHEIARLAVEGAISPERRLLLHQRGLRALAARPDPDVAALAHHAEAAGDAESVLRWAPLSAERAAASGSHREAAAQYARALRFTSRRPLEEQATLLEQLSNERYLTDEFDAAIEAIERASECYRTLGDARKQGVSLGLLSRRLWCTGRTEEAEETARQAVDMLEQLSPGRELAMAYECLASLYMNLEDAERSTEWGTRAIALAERFGDNEVLIYALNDVGTGEFLVGIPGGREKLERSLELARQAGLDAPVGRAYVHLVWAATRQRLYDVALQYLEVGLEYCRERDLELWSWHLIGDQARIALDQGRWEDAADLAGLVLREPRTSISVPVLQGLCVLGLLRARRGDPGAWDVLDEARQIAKPSGGLQERAPVAAAWAEAAWLEGDRDGVRAATDAVFELAIERRSPWVAGELACWRRRAGIQEKMPPFVAEPYALQMRGDWQQAAELWTDIGCPYESALALADADDEVALRRALDQLQDLGARAAAAIVARRLRERGVRGVPRGPRPATRKNSAGLTARELEVLALLAEGLRNADIAVRLVVSPKTVDHHVSAILRKMNVRTRGEATAASAQLGLLAARHERSALPIQQ